MQLPIVQNNSVAALIGKFEQFPVLSKEEEFELAMRLKKYNDREGIQ